MEEKHEMAHIGMLPVELLECVFSNLSGQSLIRSESVCKKWSSVIRNMQRRKYFWKERCCDEISQNVLEELLGLKSFNQKDLNDDIEWKPVYKTWIRGQMIALWPQSKKCIQAFGSDPVTCIKLSGYWIVTGHRTGGIFSWNQITGHECGLVRHFKMVTDLALIDVLQSGPYGIEGITWNHHHIISVGKDHIIKITPVLKYGKLATGTSLRVHSNALESVRVFNNHFIVACSDNTFSIWEMNIQMELKNPLSVVHQSSVIGPCEIYHWINFWGCEIQCLTQKGTLSTYRPSGKSWENSHTPSSTVALHPVEGSFGIRKAFMFRKKVFVLLTDNRSMLLTTDRVHFRSYDLMKSLCTTVISMALWGSIFALGTENGKLLLYKVRCNKDLTHLDLRRPSWAKTLSEASIISIDISDNGESATIAACTTERLFLVTWDLPSTHAVCGNNRKSH